MGLMVSKDRFRDEKRRVPHLALGFVAPISRHLVRFPTTSNSMTSCTYSLAWVARSPRAASSDVEKSKS